VATPVATETIQGGDLEAGKRKKCPKGTHRKGRSCVRHSKSHKKSHKKSKKGSRKGSRKMRGGESIEEIVAETIQGW
jgi:hypothetical protein